MNEHINIKEITLDFSNNINNEQDSTTSIYSKLGWNLGFTKPTYSGDIFITLKPLLNLPPNIYF